MEHGSPVECVSTRKLLAAQLALVVFESQVDAVDVSDQICLALKFHIALLAQVLLAAVRIVPRHVSLLVVCPNEPGVADLALEFGLIGWYFGSPLLPTA